MNPIKFQPSQLLTNFTRQTLDDAKTAKKSEPKSFAFDFFKQMQSHKTEVMSSRKQAAQARIAQLKAQIENAMRFAHIGSGNPRMVAQLAKELKSLVAQYGGSTGSVGNVSTPTLASEQGAADQAAASATDQAAGSAAKQETQTSAETAQMAEAAQVAAEASAAAASANQTKQADASQSESEEQSTTSPLNTSRQGDQGDQAFFALAKDLAQKLKLLLSIEMQKVKTEVQQKEVKSAKNELDAVDKAIEEAESSVAKEHADIAGMTASASYDASGSISSSTASSVSTFA